MYRSILLQFLHTSDCATLDKGVSGRGMIRALTPLIPPLITYLLAVTALPSAAENTTYLDPEDDKRHGELLWNFSKKQHGWEFKVNLTSYGALVQPSGGWKHHTGRNRHTAFELEYLSGLDNGLYLGIQNEAGEALYSIPVTPKKWGHWLGREKAPDGTLLYHHPAQKPLLELAEVNTPPLKPGIYQATIYAREEARLRAQLHISKDKAEVKNLSMLGHSKLIPHDRFFIQEKENIEPKALSNDWKHLNLTQKWLVYQKSPKDEAPRVIEWLFQQKDYTFIEHLILHTPHLFQTGLGMRLRNEGSPQWLRLAVHCSKRPAGHSGMQGRSLVSNAQYAPNFLAWAKKYPAESSHMKPIIAELEKGGIKAKANDKLLPPVLDIPYLRALSPTPNRTTPVETVLSIHYATANDLWKREHLRKQLTLLLKSPHWEVQQTASLAYSNIHSSHVPMDELWELANSQKADSRAREAALLGYSYGKHPLAYLDLLTIVSDPKHPLWKPALSRLGELDMGYLSTHFNINNLSDEQFQFWATERKHIRRRTGNMKPSYPSLLHWLELKEWSRALKHPQDKELNLFIAEKIQANPVAKVQATQIINQFQLGKITYRPNKRITTKHLQKIQANIKQSASKILQTAP